MRSPPLVTLLLLTSSCSWCNPTPPTPPPADSCASPSSDIGLQTLEVGGVSDGPFIPWPEDGSEVLLTRGGQGASMLGVRIRLHTAQPVECVAQKTFLLDENGGEIARREESLKVYPAADGSLATKTLWMVPQSGAYVSPGMAAQVRIELGGQTLTRRVMLRDEYELPSPLGVRAGVLCRGEVPVLVGLDRPALKGSVAVVESAGFDPGLTDVLFVPGETTAMVTLRTAVASAVALRTHVYGVIDERTLTVTDAVAPALLDVAPATVGIAEQGTALVTVNLSCAGGAPTTVTLQSEPAGALEHAAELVFPAGISSLRVRVKALGALGSSATLRVTLGDAVREVLVEKRAAAAPSGLRFSELFVKNTEEIAGDSSCDTLTGTTDAFVEIHNPASGPVELSGIALHIVDGDGQDSLAAMFPEGRVLGAGEHALFAGTAPSVAMDPWCDGVRRAWSDGRLVEMSAPAFYSWQRIRLTHGSTELDAADVYGSFNENGVSESLVVANGQTQAHRRAANHAPDRLMTPGDDVDGMGAR